MQQNNRITLPGDFKKKFSAINIDKPVFRSQIIFLISVRYSPGLSASSDPA
jgi:hypothetical protein